MKMGLTAFPYGYYDSLPFPVKPCMSHGWRISTPLRPLRPLRQEGERWLPGVSLPGSKPCGPCRTVITYPRLEHQGAHNLAGAGLLLTIQEGREVSAADFSFWEAGVWGRIMRPTRHKGSAL